MTGSSPEYFIWLSELCGAGSPLPKKVYNTFDGDIIKAYKTEKEDFSSLGFSEEESDILSNKDFTRTNMIIDYCAENRVGILHFDSEYYPKRLWDTDSPPPVLYYKGRVEKLFDRAYITAVGSRKCSQDAYDAGYAVCYKLAGSGISVVTGAAEGIDTACTLGALDAGGFAVAVLGSGINILYPFDNSPLFSRLFKTGLVITEFSPFTQPLAVNFPIRNRVMAALGNATLVVEARKNSGALITADIAKMMGRRIYVLPGLVTNELCRGSNELIKDGAIPVIDAYDIISDMEFSFPAEVSVNPGEIGRKLSRKDTYLSRRARRKAHSLERKKAQMLVGEERDKPENAADESENTQEQKADLSILTENEKKIYLSLKDEGQPLTADMLAHDTGLSGEDVLSSLTMLEIYGFVSSLAGGTYTAVL